MLKSYKISNKRSQIQRKVKLLSGVESISPKIISDGEESPCEEQEGDEVTPPKQISDKDDAPSDDQEVDDSILPKF